MIIIDEKNQQKGCISFQVNTSPANHLLPRLISTTEEKWHDPEEQLNVSAPSLRLHAQQTFWSWAVPPFMGITGRNLAEAQAERKRDVTLSLFKFLKKPWQQQARKEGENKKQDVSMGALKQTQKYVLSSQSTESVYREGRSLCLTGSRDCWLATLILSDILSWTRASHPSHQELGRQWPPSQSRASQRQ